jgi:predicted GNAT family N-acyltransferase
LWCNAREKAVKFYQNNGFEIIGEPFEIEKVGTHYVMFKKL